MPSGPAYTPTVEEGRPWRPVIGVLAVVIGVAAGLAAGAYAALVGGLTACEGSPAYGNGGISDSWVCREPYRPVLSVVEVALVGVALMSPIAGAAVAAVRSRARWLVLGVAAGALAVLLEALVNEGQVALLS